MSNHDVPQTSSSLARYFSDCFTLWISLTCVVALASPSVFSWMGPSEIRNIMITLVFIMGTTAQLDDFRACFLNPRPLIVNFAACFMVSPVIALAISRLLQLEQELAVGLILMGSVNGGSASNLFTLLAGGDIALSVIMTLSTTLGAVVCTPLATKVFVGTVMPVNALAILKSAVAIVLVPIGLGIGCRAALPRTAAKLEPSIPSLGLCMAIPLVGAIVAGSAQDILGSGASLHVAAISFHAALCAVGYCLASVTGSSERERRTVTIEIAMKNQVFACMLAAAHFPHKAVQLPPTIACIWCPICVSALAAFWKAHPLPVKVKSDLV